MLSSGRPHVTNMDPLVLPHVIAEDVSPADTASIVVVSSSHEDPVVDGDSSQACHWSWERGDVVPVSVGIELEHLSGDERSVEAVEAPGHDQDEALDSLVDLPVVARTAVAVSARVEGRHPRVVALKSVDVDISPTVESPSQDELTPLDVINPTGQTGLGPQLVEALRAVASHDLRCVAVTVLVSEVSQQQESPVDLPGGVTSPPSTVQSDDLLPVPVLQLLARGGTLLSTSSTGHTPGEGVSGPREGHLGQAAGLIEGGEEDLNRPLSCLVVCFSVTSRDQNT